MTTAADFPSIGMDLLSFYFKSDLILGSLCCAFIHFLLFYIGNKSPQTVGWFFNNYCYYTNHRPEQVMISMIYIPELFYY